MGDNKLLDSNQIVNGLAVLLSFFVGYKYALKRHDIKENEAGKKADELGASSFSETKETVSLLSTMYFFYKINETYLFFSYIPV